MTEPDVASSDARNLQTKLTKIVESNGRVKYVLNGKKWWSTGAMDPRVSWIECLNMYTMHVIYELHSLLIFIYSVKLH